MNKTAAPQNLRVAIALAACAFALPLPAGDGLAEWQLTPAGHFKPSDGRPLPVPSWYIDAAVASRVIARRQAKKNDLVIDYEHQTLNKEENGQPAPAAAWIKELFWVEGKGLHARVQLTARARQEIADGQYKYLSPVFTFDKRSGEVLDIQMAAVTNFPAIDGMDPLVARAAATFGITDLEHPDVNPLLKAILAALGLPDTTPEAEAIAACGALNLQALRDELGLAATATTPEMVAACTSLKAQPKTAAPDPAQFVPVAALQQVQGELAALTAKIGKGEVDRLVEEGIGSGKIIKGEHEKWARSLDVAALTAYLGAAAPIAALTTTQTGGQAPAAGVDEHGLTEAERAVCTATGVSFRDFAANRPKQA